MDGDFYVDYSKLDALQVKIIGDKFYDHMVVKGKAGTGKSLIALHKLGRVAPDKTAVLIVFTTSLKQYFNDGFEALGIDEKTVFNFDEWIPQKVDYVFVDECQDFSAAQIQQFIDNAIEYCYFFGDSEQSIYGWKGDGVQSVEESAKMLGVEPIELFKNYRLTKQNARLAEYVGQVSNLVNHCEKEGPRPRLFTGATINQQLDDMIRIIQNNNLTRVGILVPINTIEKANRSHDTHGYMSVEYVRDYLNAHGMPCEAKMNDDNNSSVMELNFKSTQPKVLTWSSSKGLQFNDVFIPFCENLYEDSRRGTLYVAITRCWSHLYIGYTSGINAKFLPAENSAYYEQAEAVEKI